MHIGLVQVAIKPLTRKGINTSVLMCLWDARCKVFSDSILGMITASLYDGPVYFNCYPNISIYIYKWAFNFQGRGNERFKVMIFVSWNVMPSQLYYSLELI